MLVVLCGLQQEAAILRKYVTPRSPILVLCGTTARFNLEDMLPTKLDGLVSFGVCGGLYSLLNPGDIVVGTTVTTPTAKYICDSTWAARLYNYLNQTYEEEAHVTTGMVYSSSSIITTAEEKNALFDKSLGDIVDTESFAVAAVAKKKKVPFAVVRIVSDPYDVNVPPAAQIPSRPDGTQSIWSVLSSVVSHPLQLPSLIGTASNFNVALQMLNQVAATLSGDFLYEKTARK